MTTITIGTQFLYYLFACVGIAGIGIGFVIGFAFSPARRRA